VRQKTQNRGEEGVKVLARVLLCEHDTALSRILVDVLTDEDVEVVECASLEDIDAALLAYPGSLVLTDSWTGSWRAVLSDAERENMNRLAEQTTVIVTTGRSWASNPTGQRLHSRIKVIPKPYDLDEIIEAIRNTVLPDRVR
jgi:DNA-binding NtrC family response regulator